MSMQPGFTAQRSMPHVYTDTRLGQNVHDAYTREQIRICMRLPYRPRLAAEVH